MQKHEYIQESVQMVRDFLILHEEAIEASPIAVELVQCVNRSLLLLSQALDAKPASLVSK